MNASVEPAPKTALKRSGRIALFVSVALFVGTIAWAQLTEIRGAVIASGSVAVIGKPKSIQHLDGGVVAEILSEDGDVVEAGEVMLLLDATLLRANLEIYRNRFAEASAKRDRLIAERSGATEVSFAATSPLAVGVDVASRREGQIEIFNTRAAVQRGRREQLSEKVLQFRNQIQGVQALISAKKDQLALVDMELESVRSLSEKGLARAPQLLGLQRTRADLLGQIAEHHSEVARISNSIRDTELEVLQGVNQFREEVVGELAEVVASIEELTQQILSTQKQLDRVEIRAPVSGVVHEMQIVTIGGVVAPGATVGQIVPGSAGLEFDLRVDPASIDQVFVGQSATLRLVALNQRTTPEINGEVKAISPTTVFDDALTQSFFRVRVSISADERERLGDAVLVPGMPVDAFIQTESRSVMSYLVRPLVDQIERAFREE